MGFQDFTENCLFNLCLDTAVVVAGAVDPIAGRGPATEHLFIAVLVTADTDSSCFLCCSRP